MAKAQIVIGANGGGEPTSNEYYEQWDTSTQNATKQIPLDFDPLLIMDLGTSYGSLWRRADVNSAWTKVGVKNSAYASTYITNVTGRTVTVKNPHSGSNSYRIIATDDINILNVLSYY